MFKNYLKIAIRNILKQRVYSLINIFGLAFGLTACILIGIFVYQNITYDRHYKNYENIHRITMGYSRSGGSVSRSAETTALIAPNLKGAFPQIESISRIYFSHKDLISKDEQSYFEKGLVFVDKEFLEIFDYQVIAGNIDNFLNDSHGIVVTESLGKKYFGSENPLGKTITLDSKVDLEITGVIQDVPINSHFDFDILLPYNLLVDRVEGNYLDQWGATFGSYTYFLTKPGTDIELLEEQMQEYFNELIPLAKGVDLDVYLQPISQIHLKSNMGDEIKANSSWSYILTLTTIAFLIMLLASINFVNISTARSTNRAKEIGVRKCFGAYKNLLIKQFLGESIILSFIALIVSLSIIELLKTWFNQLIGTQLMYHLLGHPIAVIFIIGFTVAIGCIAGIYPAFVLTAYKPVNVLKGTILGKKGSPLLRKSLVLFQFIVSISLIVFTLIINNQVRFMSNFDMGFQKDQILTFSTPHRMSSNWETIKEEVKAIPGVEMCSASYGAPMMSGGFGTNLNLTEGSQEEAVQIQTKMVDHDYMDLYDINIIAGSSLKDFPNRNYDEITVINETLARKIGFENPSDAIGKSYQIGLNSIRPEIVGVCSDFHDRSLHSQVAPMLILHWPYLFHEISVKVNPTNITQVIQDLETVWNKFYEDYPFAYNFMDERVEIAYRAEQRSLNVITTFSAMAIAIACLGLLGLTLFTTGSRRREIGIRKVLGASTTSIMSIISSEFLRLIALATLIACPISYYLIKSWLQDFPYQTAISPLVFIQAAAAVILISFISISFIVIRSALANPADVLKYE